MVIAGAKGVKCNVVMEVDLTLGGGHTVGDTDDVS